MISKYIISEGIELEGCLPYSAKYVLDKYKAYVTDDYSVNVPNCRGNPHAEVHYHTDDPSLFRDFIYELFNAGFKQNNTCSNHRHLMLVPWAYYVFEIYDAVAEFILDYRQFAMSRPPHQRQKYLYMLQSPFTYPIWQEPLLLKMRMNREARYTAINYMKIFTEDRSTVEIRIMPYADSPDEVLEQSVWLRNEVDKLIDKYRVYEVYDELTSTNTTIVGEV
jgi:hypothetical protein